MLHKLLLPRVTFEDCKLKR